MSFFLFKSFKEELSVLYILEETLPSPDSRNIKKSPKHISKKKHRILPVSCGRSRIGTEEGKKGYESREGLYSFEAAQAKNKGEVQLRALGSLRQGNQTRTPQSKMVALARQPWLSGFPVISQSLILCLLSLMIFLDGAPQGSPILILFTFLGAMPRFCYGD